MMSYLLDPILIVIISIITALICLKIKKSFEYFKDRNMPYIRPTWTDVFTSVLVNKITDTPLEIYEKMKAHEAYIGYFTLVSSPRLLILDPSLAEDILIKDFSTFEDHGLELDTTIDPLMDISFSMKGDRWRAMRSVLNPTFSLSKTKERIPLMTECAEKLIEHMENDEALRTDVDLKELFYLYIIPLLAIFDLGINPETLVDPNSQFKKHVHRAMFPTFASKVAYTVKAMFPRLAKILKIKYYPRYLDDYFFKLTKDLFEMRRNTSERRQDYTQLLLDLTEKDTLTLNKPRQDQDDRHATESEKHHQRFRWTESVITAQMFGYITATIEDTCYAICVTAHALGKHPTIQEELRQEISQVKGKHTTMDYPALRDLKLMGACIDEALRLYGPFPIHTRSCNQDYTLKDGNVIEKGTVVVIPAQGFHNDDRFWTDPKQFIPQRFLNEEKIQAGVYTPFGEGPRKCPAQQLSFVLIKAVMIVLLEKFEIITTARHGDNEKITSNLNQGADLEGRARVNFRLLK